MQLRGVDEDLFIAALRVHNDEYGRLLDRRDCAPLPRGLSREIIEDLDAPVTAAAVGQRLLGERPAGSRALFYALELGLLHTFVIDREGLRSHHSLAIENQALVKSMNETRYGFLASVMQERARDLMPWVAPTPGCTINELQTRGTHILFDEETAAAVADADHLIVVPTLNIGTVPFAALDPTGSGRPLVERMTITIAPNIVDLARVLPSKAPAGEPLVVGDPVGDLPGALQEANDVARKLGVSPLTGPLATKQAIATRIAHAKFLYFATHGSSNARAPLEGGLLHLANDTLSAREIQHLKLDAGLVVLSACQTGLGAAHEGGMIGLARAFTLAGVPRVLMSLWSVDDAVTRTLMGRFWDALDRCPPHEALRRAMLRTREDRPDPVYWAPFTLFGIP